MVIQRGEYDDFTCLTPHANRILDLWLGVRSRSSKGLETLTDLHTLHLRLLYEGLNKDLDFTVFGQLKSVWLDAWSPYFKQSLYANKNIENIQIDEGFVSADGTEFSSLTQLKSLKIYQGRLKSLDGLKHCTVLKDLDLGYLRSLRNLTELEHIPALRRLILEHGLPKDLDISPVYSCTGLRELKVFGGPTQLNDIAWLEAFNDLEYLMLQPSVEYIDWNSALSSKKLKKLIIRGNSEQLFSEEEVRAVATKKKLAISSCRKMGTKKSPLWVIEIS